MINFNLTQNVCICGFRIRPISKFYKFYTVDGSTVSIQDISEEKEDMVTMDEYEKIKH